MACDLCPRACKVDRSAGERGICGETDRVKVARAALHMWEEPCISGKAGSGAIFFSASSPHPIIAQRMITCHLLGNIANGTVGKEITEERLAEIFLELQEKKANNINLVTAGQFVPQVVRALRRAKDRGLGIPVVYNTSSYENVDTIKRLEGLVDIYLPDLKYVDEKLSAKYSHAPDYFVTAQAAIREMVRQTGKPEFAVSGGQRHIFAEEYNDRCDEDAEILMKKGVIVRHLLLPGCADDSRRVIAYLLDTYGEEIYISIMNQFTPLTGLSSFPELNRKISDEEYEQIIDFAIERGISNAFIQEGGTAEESFIPQFDLEGV